MAEMQSWLKLISGVFSLLAGLVTALWAYTKFILERGLLPPVQFDVSCQTVGSQSDKRILEILVNLKNLGTSTLVASNISVDVLYLESTDPLNLFEDPTQATYGRLRFPRSVRKDLHKNDPKQSVNTSETSPSEKHFDAHKKTTAKSQRGILIVPHDTFVQPGVNQVYTVVTAIPASTSYVLIRSSFQYAQHPKTLARIILFLSRRLGLIQYSLDHVTEPHTLERVYPVS
jgi:hypothetical protein